MEKLLIIPPQLVSQVVTKNVEESYRLYHAESPYLEKKYVLFAEVRAAVSRLTKSGLRKTESIVVVVSRSALGIMKEDLKALVRATQEEARRVARWRKFKPKIEFVSAEDELPARFWLRAVQSGVRTLMHYEHDLVAGELTRGHVAGTTRRQLRRVMSRSLQLSEGECDGLRLDCGDKRELELKLIRGRRSSWLWQAGAYWGRHARLYYVTPHPGEAVALAAFAKTGSQTGEQQRVIERARSRARKAADVLGRPRDD